MPAHVRHDGDDGDDGEMCRRMRMNMVTNEETKRGVNKTRRMSGRILDKVDVVIAVVGSRHRRGTCTT